MQSLAQRLWLSLSQTGMVLGLCAPADFVQVSVRVHGQLLCTRSQLCEHVCGSFVPANCALTGITRVLLWLLNVCQGRVCLRKR